MRTPVSVSEAARVRTGNLIPRPVSVVPGDGLFILDLSTHIVVNPDTPELLTVGEYLAGRLQPATGYELPTEAVAETL